MPEDPRPGHEYARPDTHPDFEVEGVGAPPSGDTTQAVDSEGLPVPGGVASKPEEVDPSQTHLVGGPEAVAASEPAADEDDEEKDFESMTKDELREHLDAQGVNVSSKATKDELVKLAEEE